MTEKSEPTCQNLVTTDFEVLEKIHHCQPDWQNLEQQSDWEIREAPELQTQAQDLGKCGT